MFLFLQGATTVDNIAFSGTRNTLLSQICSIVAGSIKECAVYLVEGRYQHELYETGVHRPALGDTACLCCTLGSVELGAQQRSIYERIKQYTAQWCGSNID